MDEQYIEQTIKRLRRSCIIHRIIYYCFNDSLIDDMEYTLRENRLKELCEEYPDIAANVEYQWLCPSRAIGSSNIEDYPDNLVAMAKRLLQRRDEFES